MIDTLAVLSTVPYQYPIYFDLLLLYMHSSCMLFHTSTEEVELRFSGGETGRPSFNLVGRRRKPKAQAEGKGIATTRRWEDAHCTTLSYTLVSLLSLSFLSFRILVR